MQSKKHEKIPAMSWFNTIFKSFNSDKSLVKDLENAKKEYPKLMSVFELQSTYTRYLARGYKALTRQFQNEIPYPDPINIFPPIKERRELFEIIKAQLDEIAQAEIEYFAGLEKELVLVRTCSDINRSYKIAAKCVAKYIENTPVTDEEWDEFHQCLDNLSNIAIEKEQNNC